MAYFCKNEYMAFRIGFGIDFHQLVEGRDLWLGGVKIPHHLGAKGHSDADVLLHAICDAMLGAAAMGDIGVHFPDTSADFKDIDSKILLDRTRSAMTAVIARILGVEEDAVSIKATTTEKMGFVGREEGLVAYASVLLERDA